MHDARPHLGDGLDPINMVKNCSHTELSFFFTFLFYLNTVSISNAIRVVGLLWIDSHFMLFVADLQKHVIYFIDPKGSPGPYGNKFVHQLRQALITIAIKNNPKIPLQSFLEKVTSDHGSFQHKNLVHTTQSDNNNCGVYAGLYTAPPLEGFTPSQFLCFNPLNLKLLSLFGHCTIVRNPSRDHHSSN